MLDTSTIERVFSELEPKNESLPTDELLFYMRRITKDLEYVIDLGFVEFWAYLSRSEDFRDFLDSYLLNMRKYNDISKLVSETTFNNSKLSMKSDDTMAVKLQK